MCTPHRLTVLAFCQSLSHSTCHCKHVEKCHSCVCSPTPLLQPDKLRLFVLHACHMLKGLHPPHACRSLPPFAHLPISSPPAPPPCGLCTNVGRMPAVNLHPLWLCLPHVGLVPTTCPIGRSYPYYMHHLPLLLHARHRSLSCSDSTNMRRVCPYYAVCRSALPLLHIPLVSPAPATCPTDCTPYPFLLVYSSC